MTNCLDCNRCAIETNGDAKCVSDDGLAHMILERRLFDDLKEFRQELFECGRECDKFGSKKDGKKVKKPDEAAKPNSKVNNQSAPKNPSPMAVHSKINWRIWGGWLLGAFSLSLLVTYIVLGVI